MKRRCVAFDSLRVRCHHLWAKQWLVLTAGEWAAGRFNCMTVGWGSLGTMWGKPFVQVVVRPVRYTFEFMERYPEFTVCAFPSRYRKALSLLGSRSGRDGDKVAEAGLTPMASTTVAAPCFAEADLVLECRKIYWDDLEPGHFLDEGIHRNYPRKDYHRVYFGEVLAIRGAGVYTSR